MNPTNQSKQEELRKGLHLILKDEVDGKTYNRIYDAVMQLIQSHDEVREQITGDTSDGYHTFNELYDFRKAYNALLFNEWYKQGKYGIHKSWKHSDGELCFGGGWFVVSAMTPTGQITNHYEEKDWELFQCEERDTAAEWDGHTAQDALQRLLALTTHPNEKEEASND